MLIGDSAFRARWVRSGPEQHFGEVARNSTNLTVVSSPAGRCHGFDSGRVPIPQGELKFAPAR